MTLVWEADFLGEGFTTTTLMVESRVATLIRYQEAAVEGARDLEREYAERPAILLLPGWSDYFFNPEQAYFFDQHGFAFYALDFHHHGRSLRSGDLGGYVADLKDYDAEISRSLEIIQQAHPGVKAVTMLGFSTGGLVATLWTQRYPETVDRLILNSPWLEMHASFLTRPVASAIVHPVARFWPERIMNLPAHDFYWRTISNRAEGEWELIERMRPRFAFPIRYGWLRAVIDGQAEVVKGPRLQQPLCVVFSARSCYGSRWRPEMHSADAVLDVRTMALRAAELGQSVTLERIPGALHDVFLSKKPVRRDAYQRLERWLR